MIVRLRHRNRIEGQLDERVNMLVNINTDYIKN